MRNSPKRGGVPGREVVLKAGAHHLGDGGDPDDQEEPEEEHHAPVVVAPARPPAQWGEGLLPRGGVELTLHRRSGSHRIALGFTIDEFLP
jgi:hypothetical protein